MSKKAEINLNFQYKDLTGAEITDGLTAGKHLASLLASSNKGDALKLFSWAQDLYAGKSLSLDPSDEATLKEFVKNHEQLTVLAKAQILEKI